MGLLLRTALPVQQEVADIDHIMDFLHAWTRKVLMKEADQKLGPKQIILISRTIDKPDIFVDIHENI